MQLLLLLPRFNMQLRDCSGCLLLLLVALIDTNLVASQELDYGSAVQVSGSSIMSAAAPQAGLQAVLFTLGPRPGLERSSILGVMRQCDFLLSAGPCAGLQPHVHNRSELVQPIQGKSH